MVLHSAAVAPREIVYWWKSDGDGRREGGRERDRLDPGRGEGNETDRPEDDDNAVGRRTGYGVARQIRNPALATGFEFQVRSSSGFTLTSRSLVFGQAPVH